MSDRNRILEISDLKVEFNTKEGLVKALQGVDLELYEQETLGLVGESGCGKSMTARAMLRIIPEPGEITAGSIMFFVNGQWTDITKLHIDSEELRAIRGQRIGMIFQEPMTSLSPVHTVGSQVAEALTLHQTVDRKTANNRAVEMLSLVGIPDAKSRANSYPFEMSGGMRQRVMIAMALTCSPNILIADEATTALDVTIQAQILELLQRLQNDMKMAIIAVTHNLGVVAAISQRVSVMYLGKIVEEASTVDIFDDPKHPYTEALLLSVPQFSETEEHHRRPLQTIEGDIPDPYTQLPGCPFHPRCTKRIDGHCDRVVPEMIVLHDTRKVRCHLYQQGGTTT